MSNLTHTDVLITGALVVGFMGGILAAELVRACQHWLARPRVEPEIDIQDTMANITPPQTPFMRRFTHD